MFKKKPVDMARKNVKKIKLTKPNFVASKEKLSWEAAEFYYYPKNKYWILGIGVLLLGCAFLFYAGAQYFHYQMVTSDYLLIIFLVLVIFVFAQYGHVEPKRFLTELNQDGVVIRGRFYSYNDLHSFWLIEEPNPILYFETSLLGIPLSSLLEEQEIEEVRNYLLRYLPEHSTAVEHLTDKLNHFLRF